MIPKKDLDVQALPGWQRHMGKEGGVADTAPLVATMDQKIAAPGAQFFIEGAADTTKCAGVDWYLARPIPVGATRLCVRYILNLNSDSVNNSNSIENDIIFTDQNDLSYNGSVQNDYSRGGLLEVSNPAAGWVSSGNVVGKYAPNVDHELFSLYQFDFLKNKSLTTTGFVLDRAFFPVPTNVATVPGVDKGWKNKMQVVVQLQQVLTVAAGVARRSYVIAYKHVDLIWS